MRKIVFTKFVEKPGAAEPIINVETGIGRNSVLDFEGQIVKSIVLLFDEKIRDAVDPEKRVGDLGGQAAPNREFLRVARLDVAQIEVVSPVLVLLDEVDASVAAPYEARV